MKLFAITFCLIPKENYLADTQKMYTNEEIMMAIDQEVRGTPGLKSFIQSRHENVIQQLDSLNLDTSIKVSKEEIQPKILQVFPNYPNPFNPQTVISYRLSVISDVDLVHEFGVARNVIGLADSDLAQLRENAFRIAFLSEDDRAALLSGVAEKDG